MAVHVKSFIDEAGEYIGRLLWYDAGPYCQISRTGKGAKPHIPAPKLGVFGYPVWNCLKLSRRIIS